MMAGMSIDMFIDPDPRSEPPPQGGELETLSGFLRWQRQTLELKCSGLDAAGLARAARWSRPRCRCSDCSGTWPDVERTWFRSFMAGQDAPSRFSSREDPDGDFDGARPDEAVVAEAWRAWREEIAFADSFVAAAPGLELLGKKDDAWRGKMSLRWVLTHMIEEYARHNGHADLLRERIDGAVGQ